MDQRDIVTVPTSGADDAAPPGRIGRYQIEGVLGVGGMGVVMAGRDEELGRPVAVKLLHAQLAEGTDGRRAAERLAREARAMAQLAHPNVLTVYEVGQADGRIFLAMELVDGETARAWVETPRSWRAVVAMMLAAGRGLAAAHAVGLVHLDFKPDNVLLGRDGRPRVADFGLATPGVSADARASGVDERTRGAGTPAYMAPEQWRGDAVGAAADQFALCATWWELLYGRRPWSTPADAADAARVLSNLPSPPSRRRHPAWLDRVLRRGLAFAPGGRWRSVAALLDAVEARMRWRARAPYLGAIALAAATATAATWVTVNPGHGSSCAVPIAQRPGAWPAARAIVAAARVISLEGPRASARLAIITRARTAYVTDLAAVQREACEATRVRHEQSDALFDARMRCLGGRRRAVDGAMALVERAQSGAALDGAVAALTSLPAVAGCEPGPSGELDDEILPPGRRAAIDAVVAAVDAVQLDRAAGRLRELPARARALVVAAREQASPRAEARALLAQAEVELDLADYDAAVVTLGEVVQTAARARAARIEAEAWIHLVVAVGFGRGQPEQGLAQVAAARAAIERAGAPVELRVRLLISEAAVLDTTPAIDAAIARLLEGRALLEAAGAGVVPPRLAIDLDAELASAYRVGDRLEESVAAGRAAIRGYQALLGPDSVDEAGERNNLGDTLRRLGRADEALTELAQSERIWRARAGETLRLGEVLFQRATALGELGRWSEAAPIFTEALAIARRELPPDDAQLGAFLGGQASAVEHTGDLDAADALYGETIAIYRRDATSNVNLPIHLYNRGELRRRRGRIDQASVDLRESIAEFERQVGANSSYLVYPLVALGRAELARGDDAAARAALTRARQVPAVGADALQVALATAYLGRATPGVEGAALRREGRAALAALRDQLPDAAAELAALDAPSR